MRHDLEYLKRRLPLLDYLQRHNWTARPVGSHQEFVGLCPLHREDHPSFYVNTRKNVFYCHGCGRGGDLIRFLQFYLDMSFRDTLAYLRQELGLPAPSHDEVLRDAARFYQGQLHLHDQALDYLERRGLHDLQLIHQMGIGYAPGGALRRHLTGLGYPSELLAEVGLINQRGYDTFYHRIVFPCFDRDHLPNLYGRSIDGAMPHRFLARPKGGLFAWEKVRAFPAVILVEGLFDLAILWQAGFANTTCAFGTHLTRQQFSQLSDDPGRQVLIAFDSDPNRAGQSAARSLARRLQDAGLAARMVALPEGHDPNSYFVSGATTEDFRCCLELAQPL